MKYNKRNCKIRFDLEFGAFDGSQSCAFTFGDGEEHTFWLSYAMGDLFGVLLDSVYGLYIEANDELMDRRIEYEDNDPTYPNRITRIVAKTTWDGEGPTLDWTLSRELDNNENKFVEITLDYDIESRVYHYKVKLVDLCYAVARAVTNILKKEGICGYHFSAVYDSINMVHFLVIKHFALTGEMIHFTEETLADGIYSSLEEELELIRFEM